MGKAVNFFFCSYHSFKTDIVVIISPERCCYGSLTANSVFLMYSLLDFGGAL